MKIDTKCFGQIDIEEDKIIDFNSGLPGFPNNKKFVILSDEKDETLDSNFYWLQSVDDGQTAFAMLNTLAVIEDYSPVIDRDTMEDFKEVKEEDLLVYNIVVIPEDPTKMTVNLKAPVLINYVEKKGMQVVANNDEYSVKHYFLNELKNKK